MAGQPLTPSDWSEVARASLSTRQYLDYKSLVADAAQAQARINAQNQHPQWDADMLLGIGRWAANQTQFPIEVYAQINDICQRAWKALPKKGEVAGNLTKMIMFVLGGIPLLIVILVFMAVVLITLVSCFCLCCHQPRRECCRSVSGKLTLACWDKLGKDLDCAWEEGNLQDRAGKTGVRGLRKVIHSCLACESCLLAIQATAEALEQVKGGIMIVNQRIDLVQEQVDTLWQIAQFGCEWKYPGLCVTSVYHNFSHAANLSKELSSYLTGN